MFKKNIISVQEHRNLMLEDLKRSNLHKPAIIKKYGFKPVTPLEASNMMERNIGYYSYMIPYKNTDKDFFRLRVLSDYKRKYDQAANSGNHIYIPDKSIITSLDMDEFLYVVEGEKKAALAWEMGVPCIAIGGVYSYKNKHGVLKEFEELISGRHIVIVFDNDLETNINVKTALHRLAYEIQLREGIPYWIKLPKGKAKGLDDYLVRYGIEAFDKLSRHEIEPSPLLKLNDKFCYIKNLTATVEKETGIILPNAEVLKRHYPRKEKIIPTDEKPKFVAVEWLYAAESREEYFGFAYVPSGAQTIDNNYNLWRDDGVTPKKGPVKPFLDYLKHIFPLRLPDSDKYEYEHLIDMMAYKLQNRDVKMRQHLVLYSEAHQIGKSTLAENILCPIFGTSNFTKVTPFMLEDQYNTWAKCKELVLFEEMTQSKYKNHSISSMLKDLQASDKVMIREMRTNSYPIDNYMTMIFNSNSFPPVFLEQHDTRHFCMSLNEEHWGQDNFKAFYSWLRTKDGLQKIRHYLEAHDYKDFNPNKPAPATKLKGTMVQENLSQEVEWIKHHLIDNRHRISDTVRELYTGDDLYQTFITDVEPARRPNKLSFYKKITRYGGFEKKQFKLSQNFSPRYYIITTDIKRSHYWLHDAKAEDVRKHLKSFGEMVPEDAKPAKFKR